MGIMTTRDYDEKSEINRRISADLRTRAESQRSRDDGEEGYTERRQTKKTGKFTWVWIVLIILAAISLFCIAFI